MIYCSKCGAQQTTDAKFCEYCGSMIPEDVRQRIRSLGGAGEQRPGFLKTIFDFSFTEFLTTRIIKLLYILGLIVDALFIIGLFFRFFPADEESSGEKILYLIIAPIIHFVIFFIYALLLRLSCEFVLVLFRVAEHTEKIERHSNQIASNTQLISPDLKRPNI